MDARKYVWLAVLVGAGLFFSPRSAGADRLPTRPVEQSTMESDPWRPDAQDSGRALLERGQTVVDDERSDAAVRQPVHHETWYRVLLRILRFRHFWGFGR
jgi:hypothetical protein